MCARDFSYGLNAQGPLNCTRFGTGLISVLSGIYKGL